MADYMSILQRSIDALPENTPTARLALYRRARETVEKQLRALQPELGEDAVRRQLAILGEAMTTIERGFAANRPSLSRPRPPSSSADTRRAPSSTGSRPTSPRTAAALNGAAARRPESAASQDRQRPSGPGPVEKATSASLNGAAPPQGAVPDAGEQQAEHPAAKQTSTSQARTEKPPGERTQGAARAAVERHEAARPDAAPSRPPRPRISPETAARLAEVKTSRMPRIALVAMVCLVVIGSGALAYHYWQSRPVRVAAFQPDQDAAVASGEKARPRTVLARQPGSPGSEDPTTSTYDGGSARIEVIPVKPVRDRSSTRTASIGAAGLPDAPARHRAILYEQTAQEEGDASIAGTVSWQPQREGEAAHALIELPDRDAQISMLIRINTDPDLPASHLIELRFNDPRALGGTVRAIPTIVAKPTEQARGEPLVGVDVPVTDRVHWIALSADDEQRDRNVALLRDGKWFDIPILFHDGKRALLTIENGGPGAMRLDPVLSKKS